eukprot:gnl/MRDRNA2_/MRDRNA2_32803_c0_seq1.p1 gnl/MRDRNA2_/MRDRNA2_32803_c0~~gnl/MRDRNA2_/MRDRNA2_32803_c0_seq1.p1  ORF type:complete len:442 (+),score=30.04 gnl/MRDRNA2_/MRDRNA2_32803_c0_seq1:22-1326(+)
MAGLVTPLKQKLKLSDLQSGALGGGFIWGFLVAAPLFAVYVKRRQNDARQAPRAIALGLALAGVCALIAGTVNSYFPLLLARIVNGVGEAGFCSLGPPIIEDSAPANKRSFFLSIYFSAIFVGLALGYMVSGFFANTWEQGQTIFLVEAVLTLPLCAVLIVKAHRFCNATRSRSLSVELDPNASPSLSSDCSLSSTFFETQQQDQLPHVLEESAASGIKVVLSSRVWLLLVLGYSASIFSQGGFGFWGPHYLEQEMGLTSNFAGVVFGGITIVCGLGGTVCGGIWLDSASKGQTRSERCCTASWICLACACLMFPVSISVIFCRSVTTFCVALAGTEFLLFMSTSPVNVAIMESVPMDCRGAAMALTNSLIHLFGDLPSPILVGVIADYTSLLVGVAVLAAWVNWAAPLWFFANVVACRSRNCRWTESREHIRT